MVGYISVVRSHEAGIMSRSTQQNARLALDQSVKIIQKSATVSITTTSPFLDSVCFSYGGHPVSLKVNAYNPSGTMPINTLVLDKYSGADCTSTAPASTTHLTDNKVSVTRFKITTHPDPDGISATLLGISLSVASGYGMDFVDTTTYDKCKFGKGSQFCSVTNMQSTAALKGVIE
jgi:hypothetical protein